jgi:hypothetical protein
MILLLRNKARAALTDAFLQFVSCSVEISTPSGKTDRLCGLVVRVSGYRSKGPGFDSRSYQIFSEVGGLERGPLSLVRGIEELLE